MDGQLKVSVIVPFYNTESFLAKCLDSLVEQSLHEIEIILIDDGSSDNSVECADTYAKKDNRIKIIRRDNGGAASARNVGIKAASGEYIGFVDSDDYVDPDFYEKLYQRAVKTNVDIVKGRGEVIGLDGKVSLFGPSFADIRNNKMHLFWSFPTCIYRRDFLIKNRIVFHEDLCVGEDSYFIMHAVLLANGMELVDDVSYHYVRRSNSLDSQWLCDEKIKSIIRLTDATIDLINVSRLDAEGYNLIYSGRITYLLDDVFHRTNSVEMRALIVKSSLDMWKKCHHADLYAKQNPTYMRHFSECDENGLMTELLNRERRVGRSHIFSLFGCINVAHVKGNKGKTSLRLFGLLPILKIKYKANTTIYRLFGCIPVFSMKRGENDTTYNLFCFIPVLKKRKFPKAKKRPERVISNTNKYIPKASVRDSKGNL